MLRAATLAALLCLPATVPAQQLPGTSSPGQAEKQFERVPVPDFPRDEFVPGRRDLAPPSGAESVVFRLRGIRFEGAVALESSELRSLAASFLDRDVSLADLYHLANQVTNRYRNAGYVLSQAVVPAQEIGEDRVATLRVLEGFVSDVAITGVEGAAREWVRAYGERITAARPLTAAVLERYMLLINDLSGLSARAVLSPSTTVPGAAELRVVAARDHFSGYAGTTNRGSKFQGPWQLVGQVERNDNLGGWGGSRVFGVTTPDSELQHLTLSRSQFIGHEGTAVSGAFSRTTTEPGAFLSVFEIDTDSENFDLTVTHPFQRSRARNLTARAKLSVYDGSSQRLDVPEGGGELEPRETRDRVRSLRLGVSYDWVDRYRGVNIVDAELSRGLDVLDASDTPSPSSSRPRGDATYTKLTGYAARVQQVGGRWSVLASVTGQYGADTLLSSEQCGAGGPNYVRAYDQSEIVGDSCIMGLLELRYTRASDWSWLDDYVAYLFVDGAEVYRRAAAGDANDASRRSLGGGLRFSINPRLSGYLELAVPLDDPVSAEMSDDPRLFLSLTGRF
jgi:hemolysin activation/secretion protein